MESTIKRYREVKARRQEYIETTSIRDTKPVFLESYDEIMSGLASTVRMEAGITGV